MYRFCRTKEILGKFHQNVCFKIPKRTNQKESVECPIFQRSCEDVPILPRTGILLLHPGEPTRKEELKTFLTRIEKDKTYKLAIQSIRGMDGCLLSCKEVVQKYEAIGGFSPLLKCASKLGFGLERRLDKDSRKFAPHKSIVAYRYAKPTVATALKEFTKDNIKHLICISLEPHFFCSKVAPAYEAIYRYYTKHEMPDWSWTIIDRWPMPYVLCGMYAQTIQYELDLLPAKHRKNVLLVFVANGLYHKDICKGDLYPYQLGTTVHNIMRVMDFNYRFTLTWIHAEKCSKKVVRPMLHDTLSRAFEQGVRSFVLVPVSYSCECLDTLHEIDVMHVQKFREQWGCEAVIHRSAAPNDHVFMVAAMSHVVTTALKKESNVSEEFLNECHGCKRKCCKAYKDFFSTLKGHKKHK